MEVLWFCVVLWGAAEVPPPLAWHVHQEARLHDVSPLAVAALLVSETSSYRRCKTGAIGEKGPFQIHPASWSRRCKVSRAGLCTYAGSARCAAWIVGDLQDKHAPRTPAWVAVRDDLDALLDAVESTPKGRPDWRAHWRCSSDHLTSPGCKRRGVGPVKRHQRALSRAWVSRGQARTLWPVVSRLGALVARSLRGSRWPGDLLE